MAYERVKHTYKGQRKKVTTHLREVQRLRMAEAVYCVRNVVAHGDSLEGK